MSNARYPLDRTAYLLVATLTFHLRLPPQGVHHVQ